jgi:hypothetical protein
MSPMAQSKGPTIKNTFVLLPSMPFRSQKWLFRSKDNWQTLIIIPRMEVLEIKEPCWPNGVLRRSTATESMDRFLWNLWIDRQIW